MKKTLQFTAVLAILLLAGTAFAGVKDPGVNKRQHKQKHRIVQGVKSGELTKQETAHLVREQKKINKKERHFKSDGQLTKKERAILHRDLNQANKHIYRQKHDGQSRK